MGNTIKDSSSTAKTACSVYKRFFQFVRLSHLLRAALTSWWSFIISSCSIFANSIISNCVLHILSGLPLCALKRQRWEFIDENFCIFPSFVGSFPKVTSWNQKWSAQSPFKNHKFLFEASMHHEKSWTSVQSYPFTAVNITILVVERRENGREVLHFAL